ncbi:MAG: 30S ribosomal protein S9 [Patescibacteria group bacterium]|mgnify:CR=1 FL=1|jgi:small subunit ribosomal protein S9|nr:30S ribosomal protein S9 [Patescibacteria group bacterium]
MSEDKKTKKATTKKTTVKKVAPKEKVSIKAKKYIKAIGRRKTSVAQVRMYEKGKGEIIINDKSALDYFKKEETVNILTQPLKLVSKLDDFDFSIIVKGGGYLGQVDAIKHGIARALVKYDPELKTILKTDGHLTRDPRKKERKKPGLKKARKASQWSKR